MAQSPGQSRPKETGPKVVILGPKFSGKTELLTYTRTGAPSGTGYRKTMGIDTAVCTLRHEGTECRLSLWEAAGQDKDPTYLSRFLYTGAHAFVILLDVNAFWTEDNQPYDSAVVEAKRNRGASQARSIADTFRTVVKWRAQAEAHAPGVRCVLGINKVDYLLPRALWKPDVPAAQVREAVLSQLPVMEAQLEEVCREHGFDRMVFLSGVKGIGVQDLWLDVARKINAMPTPAPPPSNGVDLGKQGGPPRGILSRCRFWA